MVAGTPTLPTAFVAAGGEAPIEQNPASKYCIESQAELPKSVLWRLQSCYYEATGEQAWEGDVPSFVSSNAKLAKDYARIIFHFLRDIFSHRSKEQGRYPAGPCLLLEIGAGHGRFTFLLLKCILEYEQFFEPLGMPAKPFVLYFTDIAEANINACRANPDLKPFVDAGWLDFALFDANEPPEPHQLRELAGHHCSANASNSDVPAVVICNYVLDSLIQEAFQVDATKRRVQRGFLSVYSPQEEKTFHDPSLNSRLSFSWNWEDCTCMVTNKNPDAETPWGDAVRAVIKEYLDCGENMTVLIPIGAFRVVEAFRKFAGNNMLMLVGDKGHQDTPEFYGWRAPHLAVHGSFSFMVNFHALRIFFEQYGGFAVHTPYHDCFQSGVYALGARDRFPSLLSAMAESRSDFGPASLVSLTRQLACSADLLMRPDVTPTQDSSLPLLKSVMSLLRYSGHDPNIFWQFHSLILSQCCAGHLSGRGVRDLALDLEKVYKNSFRMGHESHQDIAVAIADCLVRMGRPGQAAEYYQHSVNVHGPRVQVLLQLSACLQARGRFTEATEAVQWASRLEPSSSAVDKHRRSLEMFTSTLGTVLIGGAHLMLDHVGPVIARDLRFHIKAVFAFDEEEAHAVCTALQRWNQVLVVVGQEPAVHHGDSFKKPDILWGSDGFHDMLKREDLTMCVVDVHHKVHSSLLPKLWAAGKHVLTNSPLAYSLAEARELLSIYKTKLHATQKKFVWHALESACFEDALVLAGQKLGQIGCVRCISVTVQSLVSSGVSEKPGVVPIQEHMAFDLAHALAVVLRVTTHRIVSISGQLGAAVCSTDSARQTGSAEAGSLVGHFMVGPAGDRSAASTGSFVVVCRQGIEPSLDVNFQGTGGSLTLKREKCTWSIVVTCDQAGTLARKINELSVACMGYRSSNQAFLENIQKFNLSADESRDEQEDAVDGSVEFGLLHAATIESIFASMKSGGATMTLKYAN